MSGFDELREKPIETRLQRHFGDEFTHIGEGEMAATIDGVTSLRGVRESLGI